MAKFKIGDKVAVKASDDHPSLDKSRSYRITEIDNFNGENFVKTNLTGDEFFFERRFVFGKNFKGNK